MPTDLAIGTHLSDRYLVNDLSLMPTGILTVTTVGKRCPSVCTNNSNPITCSRAVCNRFELAECLSMTFGKPSSIILFRFSRRMYRNDTWTKSEYLKAKKKSSKNIRQWIDWDESYNIFDSSYVCQALINVFMSQIAFIMCDFRLFSLSNARWLYVSGTMPEQPPKPFCDDP